jgi:hypothetical protein
MTTPPKIKASTDQLINRFKPFRQSVNLLICACFSSFLGAARGMTTPLELGLRFALQAINILPLTGLTFQTACQTSAQGLRQKTDV